MATEDSGLDEDLGEATIVYEDPEEGTVERTVPNEHVAYFQDHWIVKVDTDEQGRDLVRRIPAQRVYYVERSVEEFEEEVRTLRDRVQSVAEDLRTRIPIGGDDVGNEGSERDPYHINIRTGEDEEHDDGDRSGGESDGEEADGENGDSGDGGK